MLPLTVLSWDFHAQANLTCLGVLAAGHSWRQEQRPGVRRVSPWGTALSQPRCRAQCGAGAGACTVHTSSFSGVSGKVERSL